MVKYLTSLVILLSTSLSAEKLINKNSTFEDGLKNWTNYIGPGLKESAKIEVKKESRDFPTKHIFMRLPANATDNQSQYIKIGQYLELNKNKKYRYSINVKWLNPDNKLPSAIISVWTKDGKIHSMEKTFG